MRVVNADDPLPIYFEGEIVSESRAKALIMAGEAHIARRTPHGPQGACVELERGPTRGWEAQRKRNLKTMAEHWNPEGDTQPDGKDLRT